MDRIERADGIIIRLLPADEWARLAPIYREHGDELPPAEHNEAVIAELQSEIIGVDGINLVVHKGPLWVHPGWRRRLIATQMSELADARIRELGAKGYLMFPSNPFAAAVAKRMGLIDRRCAVWEKEL